MANIKSVAIFCGSKPGFDPAFVSQAESVGSYLAHNNIALVYGGANSGLMGAVATSALRNGGEVIGVMPTALERSERIHTELSTLIKVDNLQQRKAKMAELSEGFIALPGGTGTLDEMFEMITLSQMGQHKKPCGFLDTEAFYHTLFVFLEELREKGFLHADYFDMLIKSSEIDSLLNQMNLFIHPHT